MRIIEGYDRQEGWGWFYVDEIANAYYYTNDACNT
jgi:hypothetical protein